MAVPEQTPYSEHTGNGSTTSFALGFQCETKDHLIVLVDGIEPPIATWSLTGGNVVFTTAPAAGKKITLQRNTPFSRTTDYQSYNNSFRPPAVNKDFDWIWWKLQELGVADWILGARIDALKNYVDRKDDELKAYLLEEIRKQGVALDQLDEYYNYLMERLAQIAVDKGWDASFVVDGDKNQHQINASFHLNSLTDYKTIVELKNAELTARKANVAGVLYEWISDEVSAADDVYYIQSSLSATGRWVNLERKLKSSAKSSLAGLFRSEKCVEINLIHDVSDTITLDVDRTKIEGYGDSTGFNWLGGDGPEQANLALLKPVLAAKKSAISQAISNLRLIDFKINLDNAKNICGVDSRYITNNSKIEGVRVEAIGVNSVGFYISKQWYSRYVDCYASGQVSNNREGIGVYLDTRSAEGTVNQVNAIMLDISVRELRYGYLVDPSRYVYSLIIPSWVTIEKCRVGLKVVGTDSPFIVRNAVISAYFEANTTDVEWGSDSDTRVLDQKITWLGASFNDTGSRVVLNQGQHHFIGCTGLESLVVANTATVKLENTYVDNIINNTGNPDAIINNYNPNVQQGASQFGALSAKSLKSKTYTATLPSGSGANSVTIDLYTNGVFSLSIPTRGQKARIVAFARRPSDTATGFIYQGTLVRTSTGSYLVHDPGTWSITASIDSAGVLTLTSAGGDTKYYDITVTAM